MKNWNGIKQRNVNLTRVSLITKLDALTCNKPNTKCSQ